MRNFVFSVYESMSEEASVCMLHVGVSLYMCVYIYNVYAYTCESVCVLRMLEFLCVWVYIYSVYACIWESLFMSELSPNFSEDVRTCLFHHMDKHYN